MSYFESIPLNETSEFDSTTIQLVMTDKFPELASFIIKRSSGSVHFKDIQNV